MKKRILSSLLCLALCLTLLPAAAFAEDIVIVDIPKEPEEEPTYESTEENAIVEETISDDTDVITIIEESDLDSTEESTTAEEPVLFMRSASVIASGSCGTDVRWALDSAGTLTISGTGAMRDYRTDPEDNVTPDPPWVKYDSDAMIHTVVVEEGVTRIGNAAFLLCDKIRRVYLPDTLTEIGNGAFFKTPALEYINIPGSVLDVGLTTFNECPKLVTAGPIGSGCNVEFGWTESIPDNAFGYFDCLQEITIPNGVTSIGTYAFYYCDSLTSITIPDSVTSIGDYAFAYCDNLCEVYFTGPAPAIDYSAFCEVIAKAYYPTDDVSWTSEKR